MKTKRFLLSACCIISMLAILSPARAQDYAWERHVGIAGNTVIRTGNVFLPGKLNSPGGITRDAAGNIIVADTGNHCIRKISPSGIITTLAGNGQAGSANGTGTEARFNSPRDVAVAPDGSIFVLDQGNRTIRRILTSGYVTTIAGKAGEAGTADGIGSAARFGSYVSSISIAPDGNLFVGDDLRIRRCYQITLSGRTFWRVETIAPVTNDGSALLSVTDLECDFDGSVWIADNYGPLRKLTPDRRLITPFQGAFFESDFRNVISVSLTDNFVWACTVDSSNQIGISACSREGSQGALPSTSAGPGYRDGFPASYGASRIAGGLGDTLLVSDWTNHAIRKTRINSEFLSIVGAFSNVFGEPGIAGSDDGTAVPTANSPCATARDSKGNIYISDQFAHTIHRITPEGNFAIFAGFAGVAGYKDGTGTSARFQHPTGLAVDRSDNLIVCDHQNNVIRKITPAGVVSTLIGASAGLNLPTGVVFDGAGNLFVADSGNAVIRKVTPSGQVSVFAGVVGVPGFQNGTGAAARFRRPLGIGMDAYGNLYVGDTDNHAIRRITPQGVVTTIAGSPSSGSANGIGTVATFNQPFGVLPNPSGTKVLVADFSNNSIRSLDLFDPTNPGASQNWNVSTLAGAFKNPTGISHDTSGRLLVADQFNNRTLSGRPAAALTVMEKGKPSMDPYRAAASFGSVARGASREITLTLRNTGTGELSVGLASFLGGNAGDFRIISSATGALAANATRDVKIRFTPSGNGTRQTLLRFISSDGFMEEYDVRLSGTGISVPEINIANGPANLTDGGSTISFGPVNRGSSRVITLTIRNSGTNTLSGIVASLAGGSTGDFAVLARPSASLAPGASATLGIRFTPSANGARTTTLRIASNDANENPFDVALTGTGVGQPEINVLRGVANLTDGKATVNFGKVAAGKRKAVTLSVRNSGTATLTDLSAKISGNKRLIRASKLPATLEPGASATLRVVFRPDTAGKRGARIAITSNDANEAPFDIALAGTGIGPEIKVLQKKKNFSDGKSALRFGRLGSGTGKVIALTIRNSGNRALLRLKATINGKAAGHYRLIGKVPKSIKPGKFAVIRVRFLGGKPGNYLAALHIRSNDANERSFDLKLNAKVVKAKKPAAKSAVASPLTQDGMRFNTFTAEKRDGVFPRIEVSGDLVNWRSGANFTEVLSQNEERIRVRDLTPVSPGSKRFIRARHP